MNEKIKNANAITLIALIVTVIILLILAGITVASLIGDNGLLKITENSKMTYEISAYQDLLEQESHKAKSEYGLDYDEVLQKIREKIEKNYSEEFIYISEIDEYNGEKFIQVKTKEGYWFKITEEMVEYLNGEIIKLSLEAKFVGWENGKGIVKFVNSLEYTNEEYYIYYSYDDNKNIANWINTLETKEATVKDIENGKTIYGKLVGQNQSSPSVDLTVKDEIPPTVSLAPAGANTRAVSVNVTANDLETGMPETPTYTFYISEDGNNYTEVSTDRIIRNNNETYTIDKLEQEKTYYIKVATNDIAGNTGNSDAITATTSLLALAQGDIEFVQSGIWNENKTTGTLNINSSAENAENLFIQYQINSTSEAGWSEDKPTGTTLTNLVWHDNIYARLTDGYNVTSYATFTIEEDIPPKFSQEITSSVTENSITIEAVAIDDESGMQQYDYYQDGVLKGTNTTGTYTFTGLSPNTEYAIKVVATDKAGNTAEKESSITTDYAHVTGIAVTPTEVTLFIRVAESQQLTATITPSDAYNKNYTWSSSNTSVATADSNGLVKAVAVGTATITATTVDGGKTATCQVTVKEAYGIVPAVYYNNTWTGEDATATKSMQTLTGKYNATGEFSYNVRVQVLEDGGTYDDDGEINGTITFKENKALGNQGDCGDATSNASRMCVVIVNGNLTVESGVLVRPYSTAYGGPKGMYLCVKGTLTNNGAISMTIKGAKAQGENVYLYNSETTGYGEYVPATGAAGGASKLASSPGNYAGNTGSAGIKKAPRATGGGGSGAVRRTYGDYVAYSGAGSEGTSYSGGSGGGAGMASWNAELSSSSASKDIWSSIQAKPLGGAGGQGGFRANGVYVDDNYYVGGGAGNPGSKGAKFAQNTIASGNSNSCTGKTGTGGLLILYADSIINTGKINSNGSIGGTCTPESGWYVLGGGSSGGGSVNIFYKSSYSNSGTVEATGGSAASGTRNGGAGGDGTVTVTKIIL